MNSSNLTQITDPTVTTSNKSNNSSFSSTSVSSKNYLIDKLLLSGGPKMLPGNHDNSYIERNDSKEMHHLVYHQNKVANNNTTIINKSYTDQVVAGDLEEGLDDDNEDLVSETGTYTIDVDSPKQQNGQDQEQVVDLVSARAAIDETFGIVVIKRPEIDNDSSLIESHDAKIHLQQLKQTKARMSRQRNKTYSLTKDLLIQNNGEPAFTGSNLETAAAGNLSFSASSSSSISSYSNESKLRKVNEELDVNISDSIRFYISWFLNISF
jgi:hypothetical protein